MAVVHHGYARTTEDIEVLVERVLDGPRAADPLSMHGFEQASATRPLDEMAEE
ncbi:MAG: hypothetical protein ACRENE_09550 [Polyangiaceae bacterium]